MKKIGLIVRYDCNNYGSMLQILATQKSIEKYGRDYEIIRYDKFTPAFYIKSLSRIANRDFLRGKVQRFKKKIMMSKHKDLQRLNSLRNKKFSEFRNKYIGPYSVVYKGYNNLSNGALSYDAVMVGSDQLWAPAGLESNYYNLMFVPDHIRKISYATSFGVSSIPSNQREKTKKYLDRIEFISVRENSGKGIVKELTNRECVVAADPTLIFNCAEWEEMIPSKKIIDGDYIFAYFLGNNIEYRKVINELSKLTGLRIVSCPHMDSYNKSDIGFGDIQRYETGPEDFLNLIRGAKYVCTDSFHGTIFSLLNRKQFVTFNRFSDNDNLSKNTRIDSLFDILNLNERRCYDILPNELLNKLDTIINYADVESRLERLRNSTKVFLQEALK